MSCYTTSVIGFKYKNGTLLASDTQVSSNGHKSHHTNKIFNMSNSNTITAVSINGMFSDVCDIKEHLDSEIELESLELSSNQIFKIVKCYIYKMRSNQTPRKASIVVADNSTLKVINSKGCHWSSDAVATGIGAHILLPLIESTNTLELSKEEALEFARSILRVSLHKDKTASNKIQLVTIDKNDGFISQNESLRANPAIGQFKNEIKLE